MWKKLMIMLILFYGSEVKLELILPKKGHQQVQKNVGNGSINKITWEYTGGFLVVLDVLQPYVWRYKRWEDVTTVYFVDISVIRGAFSGRTSVFSAQHGDEQMPTNVATDIGDFGGGSFNLRIRRAQDTGIHTIHGQILANIWMMRAHTKTVAPSQTVLGDRVRNTIAFDQLAA